jgi:hypothetical protein
LKKRVGHERGLTELTAWMAAIVFHPWMIGLLWEAVREADQFYLHVVRSDSNIPCQHTLSPSRGKVIEIEVQSTSGQVRPTISFNRRRLISFDTNIRCQKSELIFGMTQRLFDCKYKAQHPR